MAEVDQIKTHLNSIVDIIDTGFVTTLNEMINEIDLAFDYVDKTVIKKLYKYSKILERDSEFRASEKQKLKEILKEHEEKLFSICDNKSKLRNIDFEFLNDLRLFGNLLDMNVFKDENKNTKRTLVNYINSLYMTVTFGNTENFDESIENLTQQMNDFIQITKSKYEKQNEIEQNTQSNEQSNSSKGSKHQSKYRNKNEQVPEEIGNLFATIMENPEVMNMAQDLSKQFKNGNVNPMSMITSLMSGKSNPKLDNIVNKITSDVERKIEMGQIDPTRLQEQTASIMQAMNKTDLSALQKFIKK